MKVGEILRQVADQIDAKEAEVSADKLMRQSHEMAQQANAMAQNAANQAMDQSVDLAPEPEEVDVENIDCTDTETMVPPLQQKHELLKKATGVENNVDDFADECECGEVDELEMMKKMAGIGQGQEGPIDHAVSIRPVNINPRANAAMAHFASDNYDAE